MNNPNNPFVPKGTLLDLQGRRRSQFKLAVFCVLAVSVVGLSAMLIQGCERKKPVDETANTDFGLNTNLVLNVDTNLPPLSTNAAAVNPPMDTNTIANVAPVADAAAAAVVAGVSEYKIAKGDTLAVIAHKNGVSLKALEAANPKLNPKKLHIGDKVEIPAATAKATALATTAAVVDGSAYVVKHGDSLGHIAKAHGITVSALKAANNLTTDRINVGQKLTIPTKAEAAPAAPVVEAAPVAPAAPAMTPPPPVPAAPTAVQVK